MDDDKDIAETFDQDMEMARLKKELAKRFQDYQKTMKYMVADAPIGVLCLPPAIENILLDQGFLRVYDLFDADLVKIKGMGVSRIKQLTASLDKFFSML